jgi:hypothetical protein
MKDDQVTLRLPAELYRALQQRAIAEGVPKSQVVREALQTYLVGPPRSEREASSWQRVSAMVGSLSLDDAEIERDALASQLRAHNWRD